MVIGNVGDGSGKKSWGTCFHVNHHAAMTTKKRWFWVSWWASKKYSSIVGDISGKHCIWVFIQALWHCCHPTDKTLGEGQAPSNIIHIEHILNTTDSTCGQKTGHDNNKRCISQSLFLWVWASPKCVVPNVSLFSPRGILFGIGSLTCQALYSCSG